MPPTGPPEIRSAVKSACKHEYIAVSFYAKRLEPSLKTDRPEACPTSPPRKRQPKRSHLLAIANQQHIAGQHRVIPGLAIEGREPRELRELIGGRPHQRQLSLFRQNHQQILIGQQDELAIPVA